MKIKAIIDEDFTNYKKPSMLVGFPYCFNFKCETDCGIECCQNSTLATSPNLELPISFIVNRYLNNKLTSALVIGGLEPIDSFDELYELIAQFRAMCNDTIVIYTGYTENEIQDKVKQLSEFQNIIVKFGRFVPNMPHHTDELLGVELASPNQYAKQIS